MSSSNKNNIVIFIRTLKSGGAEKQSSLLAKALKDSFNVILVVQRGEFVEEKYIKFLNENKINYELIKGKLWRRSFTFYKLLRKHKTQIIFSYLTSDNFWSAIIGKLAGVKYLVGGVRSNYLPWHKFLIMKSLNKWVQNCTVFNNNAGFQEFVKNGFVREKSPIIPNCIDEVPLFQKRDNSETIKLLTVARFIEGKDHLTAIKSFHHLINEFSLQNKKIEYIIIGHGELENQIVKWISEYELQEFITVKINPKNLMDYYVDCDIYLCASVYEGFSNSIMEAMICSMPVVATDVGDNKSQVEDGVTGYIVPPKDYVGIAEKIFNLIESYEDRISFGKAGNDLIKTQFSLEKFRVKYLDLIDKLA